MLFLLSKYMFHLWNVGRKKVNGKPRDKQERVSKGAQKMVDPY